MEKLFESDADWWNNAMIEPYFHNRWEAYAEGYKNAAEILVEKLLIDQRGADTQVYPIVFLYRHFMELRLKEIIEHGSKLLDRQPIYFHHHDILTLWQVGVKPLVLELWPDSPEHELSEMQAVFNEFTQIDKKSFAFRYPRDKNGNPCLSKEVINVRRFVEGIQNTVNMLQGIAFGISVFEDDKRHMERNGH